MKQIPQTPEVKDKLRAAYGPDADLTNLAVFETVAMNTLPLRKTSGLFKGARLGLSLMSESAAWINKESVPVNTMHGDESLPIGRAFSAAMVGDAMHTLFAIDGAAQPKFVQGLNSGTIDQVSVGQLNKAITCNKCGFDFMGPDATFSNVWDATCNDGHVMGDDGAHAMIDGLQSFFELSLVSMGAVNGAKIIGPTDAKLVGNEPLRLAASASKVGALRLTCSTINEDAPVDKELLARLEAQAGEKSALTTQLTALTAERDSLKTQAEASAGTVTTLTAKVAELEPVAALATENAALAAKAVAALTTEAKTILTACSVTHEGLATDVDGLLATIAEHRVKFAAGIPVGGLTNGNPADLKALTAAAAPSINSAFRTPGR